MTETREPLNPPKQQITDRKTAAEARALRLAEALRTNLRRRKAQAKARKDDGATSQTSLK